MCHIVQERTNNNQLVWQVISPKGAPKKPANNTFSLIDKQVQELINKMQLKGNIQKVADGLYQVGSKKITLSIINGFLVGM